GWRGEVTVDQGPGRDGGVTVVRAQGARVGNPAVQKHVTLIPYYLWANRGVGEMTVWVSGSPFAIGDVGPAGGFVFYENPNYAADGWRFLEAAPFDQSAGARWGCFRHAIPGARGAAVGTGQQNTAAMLRGCSDPGRPAP